MRAWSPPAARHNQNVEARALFEGKMRDHLQAACRFNWLAGLRDQQHLERGWLLAAVFFVQPGNGKNLKRPAEIEDLHFIENYDPDSFAIHGNISPLYQNFHHRLRFGGSATTAPVGLVGGNVGSAMGRAVAPGLAGGKLGRIIIVGSRGFFSGSSSSGPRPIAVLCGGRGGGRFPEGSVFGCGSSFSMCHRPSSFFSVTSTGRSTHD
jgi:hypothetical protein